MTDLPKAGRIADDAIYLDAPPPKEPKRLFVKMRERVEQTVGEEPFRLMDVGCAAGEFFNYIRPLLPSGEWFGVDISPNLVEATRRRFPDVTVFQGDVSRPKNMPDCEVDIVTMSGVLNCLDDPKPALDNLLDAVRPGGRVIVWDMFNRHPVDVLMRHRRVEADGETWETGWNNFSIAGIERYLKDHPQVAGFEFEPFDLGMQLAKTDDPMRTWTIDCDGNPYQLVNGAGQLVCQYFLTIDKASA